MAKPPRALILQIRRMSPYQCTNRFNQDKNMLSRRSFPSSCTIAYNAIVVRTVRWKCSSLWWESELEATSDVFIKLHQTSIESSQILREGRPSSYPFIHLRSMASADEKYELITRGLQEVLGGDSIKAILAEGRTPKCYWGKGTL